eukprot:6035837-Amphidinium_carterae.1
MAQTSLVVASSEQRRLHQNARTLFWRCFSWPEFLGRDVLHPHEDGGDVPVLEAAQSCEWRPFNVWRLKRSDRQSAGFGCVWRFQKHVDCEIDAQAPVHEDYVIWYDADGSPSAQWEALVGALYYWFLRAYRPEHSERPPTLEPESHLDCRELI